MDIIHACNYSKKKKKKEFNLLPHLRCESSLFTLIREQDYLLETGNSPCALFSHQKEVQEIVKKVNGYYTCL
ncbi:MAG: hypothetical protein ACFFAS_09135 [Promethearchaeota archaeon]